MSNTSTFALEHPLLRDAFIDNAHSDIYGNGIKCHKAKK